MTTNEDLSKHYKPVDHDKQVSWVAVKLFVPFTKLLYMLAQQNKGYENIL